MATLLIVIKPRARRSGDTDDSGLADMLITVIAPAFNRAHTLQDTYRSLLSQGVHLEWIVVDDGSTDGTGQLD